MAKAGETRRKFIDSAEILFGLRGIDQVRTKELLAAAEQKNESALQYHFGSRAGLIDAIVKERMMEVDHRRKELLADVEARGATDDPKALIRVMLQPIAERVAYGEHGQAFVGLLAQVAAQPEKSFPEIMKEHDLDGAIRTRNYIIKQAEHIPVEILQQRDRLLFNMAASAFKHWAEHRDLDFDIMLDDLIASVYAVFSAPVEPSAHDKAKLK